MYCVHLNLLKKSIKFFQGFLFTAYEMCVDASLVLALKPL